ncbi:MAG: imelysin family protein, partial [Draconibacterium sp.]
EGGAEEQAILDALEIEVGTPYGEEFKTAGEPGSRYISQANEVDEMLQRMIAIADEVANAKIADPHTSENVLDVESWFSWNSLVDFQNNVRSIENAYLGGYVEGSRDKSISDFVKEQDAALDTEIRQKITAAINAIAAIPYPFRNNLTHDNVQSAMDAVNALGQTIDTKVRPMVVD